MTNQLTLDGSIAEVNKHVRMQKWHLDHYTKKSDTYGIKFELFLDKQIVRRIKVIEGPDHALSAALEEVLSELAASRLNKGNEIVLAEGPIEVAYTAEGYLGKADLAKHVLKFYNQAGSVVVSIKIEDYMASTLNHIEIAASNAANSFGARSVFEGDNFGYFTTLRR